MSIEGMNWLYAHSKSTGPARAVMLVICDTTNAKHGYRFFMTRPELARRAGVAERTAQKALKTLIELGEIERISSGRPGAAAVYVFTQKTLDGVALYKLKERRHVSAERRPQVPAFGVPGAHQTTNEHIENELSKNETIEKIKEARRAIK